MGVIFDLLKNELIRVASKWAVSVIIRILEKCGEHLYKVCKAVFINGEETSVEIVELRRSVRKREPPQYYGFEEDVDSEQEESDDESSDDESDGNTPPLILSLLLFLSHTITCLR